MKKNSLFEERRKTISNDIQKSVVTSFEIVDRIHEILEEKGLKQKDLAYRLGKSEAEISKWMRGTHNFTLATIASIEVQLGEPIIRIVSNKNRYQQAPVFMFISNNAKSFNLSAKDKKSDYHSTIKLTQESF